MAVYDALVRADAALTVADLAASVTSVRLGAHDILSDLDDAVASLCEDGLCWREGDIVGLVVTLTPGLEQACQEQEAWLLACAAREASPF